jgi:hypothetical protein
MQCNKNARLTTMQQNLLARRSPNFHGSPFRIADEVRIVDTEYHDAGDKPQRRRYAAAATTDTRLMLCAKNAASAERHLTHRSALIARPRRFMLLDEGRDLYDGESA